MTTETDLLATVPAEEREKIRARARAEARRSVQIVGVSKGTRDRIYEDVIRREVAAWHAAHPAAPSPTPETLTREQAESIAAAPFDRRCPLCWLGHTRNGGHDAERHIEATDEQIRAAFDRERQLTREGAAVEALLTVARSLEIDTSTIRDATETSIGSAVTAEVRALRDPVDGLEAKLIERDAEIDRLRVELAARPAPGADAPPLHWAVSATRAACDVGDEQAALVAWEVTCPRCLDVMGRAALERTAPAAEASLEARAKEARRIWRGDEAPWDQATSSARNAWLAVVRAVDASRPALPEVDAEDLWTDYRTGRGTVFASDRKAFLAGVEAGRRTSDASRPTLTIKLDTFEPTPAAPGYHRSIRMLDGSAIDRVDVKVDPAGCVVVETTSRPGLTEEQARLLTAEIELFNARTPYPPARFENTLAALLRASRGEVPPAAPSPITHDCGDVTCPHHGRTSALGSMAPAVYAPSAELLRERWIDASDTAHASNCSGQLDANGRCYCGAVGDPVWHRRMPDMTIACNDQRPNEDATDNPAHVTCPDCQVAQAQMDEEKKP